MKTLIEASHLSLHYGRKAALQDLTFSIPAGRVVGLLGHNGAGKTTLMKTLVGLKQPTGQLRVLGLDPHADRARLLTSLCYIPDVAVLPSWARVSELIRLMAGLQPRFSTERARQLLRRTSVGENDKVKHLSKGMVTQLHLALVAAIDAKLMILDEPTLGLDVMSRKSFYEMLIDEWCDGERSVLISTHQVEEVESLLSDVIMLDEGRLVLDISLAEMDERFVALSHDPEAAEAVAANHPLLRYRVQGRPAALFDGVAPDTVAHLGQRVRPSLVDLFMALTRKPEIQARTPESA
ncbi:ABC-2 type transport system ATP-binding protein [Mitsuaria sp. BK045]|jgi:ABC-2 type transport system ATP-binding protein|nr:MULTISPECIES: ABC transporter ATP-binding protein [unclassified Roseateles]MBB3296269.1 ABC-2 type transport system ATP-binding protein [Mitsuaria sp. BK041]MBB3365484.1 ABC-2 type transport system ATP-binding protein [Mitsuaria sp. BK045]